MASLSVHPHRGFLNTKFTVEIFNCAGKILKLTPIEYYNDNSKKIKKRRIYQIDSEHFRNLIEIPNPGRYSIEIDGDSSLSEELIVEDAIKFGGSIYKGSYVFENTPWCFIVMKDRTYFYNRDSKQQYIEFISPDNIRFVNRNIVLFSNNDNCEKTLYSLDLQKPIINYCNEIYLSSEILITEFIKDNDGYVIDIYKFHDKILKSERYFCDNYIYSIKTNTFYIARKGIISAISLDNLLDKENVECSRIDGNFLGFTNECLAIFLQPSRYSYGNMLIYDLDEEKIILSLGADYPIVEVGKNILIEDNILDEIKNTFDKGQLDSDCVQVIEFKTLHISEIYICEENVYYVVEEENYKEKQGGVINYRSRTLRLYNSEFVYPLNINSKIYQYKNELHISHKDAFFVIKKDRVIYENKGDIVHKYNGEIFFSHTYSKDIEYVYKYVSDGVCSIIIKDRVLWNWFDEYGIIYCPQKKLIYLVTEKGFVQKSINSVLRRDCQTDILRDGNKLIIHNKQVVEKNISIPEHLKTLSESQNYALLLDGCSVYMGSLCDGTYVLEEVLSEVFDKSNYKKVVFSDDASHIVFMKGKDMVLKNLISSEETLFINESYIEHKNGYRTTLYVDAYRRPRFLDPVNRQYVDENYSSQYIFTSPNGRLFADTQLDEYVKIRNKINNSFIRLSEYKQFVERYDMLWSDTPSEKEKKKKSRERFMSINKGYFINNKIDMWYALNNYNFSDWVYEKVGYAIIKELSTGKIIEEIELGPALWFLNYVAFSFDSNYVAIAGRYPNNSSFGGLYLVYNLKLHKTVLRKTDGYAIWNVAFSIEGKCCGYSSVPTTYMGNCSTDRIKMINGRSFLTFSPDGKFMALSEQGYIPYKNGTNHNWGHQPSTNVYIYDTNTLKQLGNVISDLADGGLEGNRCAKTVISCSFSQDNSKLMMVGGDGTIIIRNIHLDN